MLQAEARATRMVCSDRYEARYRRLVMAIEEGFAVNVGNIDMDGVRTVGDLQRAMVKVGLPESALAKIFERRGITPETPLSDLLD